MESLNARKCFAMLLWRILQNSMPILKDLSIPGVLVVTGSVSCCACDGFNSGE